ncbi:hypothetical protein CKO15_10065 [Halorhodospira abdelmalekii]|uniref:universal stress protein n=1 Tax=Halorhodospira abdelmalekii TaxID=421629 RepID=UPI0019068E5E|nr:universal stress protein [Halorhodospira abdelmalekii]MBK1735623.1 hypothetical protein [Halorhodospira abdelmalekii]
MDESIETVCGNGSGNGSNNGGEPGAGHPPTPPRLHRVVVLLDASRASLAALELAADCAARRGAELLALFVEEKDLLRCAGYPWAQEIGLSGTVRKIEASELEAAMRDRAAAAQAALARAADGRLLKWQLQVTRGRVAPATLAITRADDLLLLGRVGYARARGLRIGSTVQVLALEAPGPVIVCTETSARAAAVRTAVLAEPGTAGLETLTRAHHLFEAHERLSTVLVNATDEAAVAPLRQWLTAHHPQAQLLHVPHLSDEVIAHLVEERGIEKLLFSRRHPLLAEGLVCDLVERLRIPVTIVP